MMANYTQATQELHTLLAPMSGLLRVLVLEFAKPNPATLETVANISHSRGT
jgi:hypothetical protein